MEVKMKLLYTDMLIAGLGPGGFTAALYGAEALLPGKVTIVSNIGSQADTTPEITNWPGVPRMSGQDFQKMINDHFEELIIKYHDYLNVFIPARVVGVELAAKDQYMVNIRHDGKNQYVLTRALLIATGARNRNLKGAEHFVGKGISFCATCDASLYEGRKVWVYGSGNTALENAIMLHKHVSSLTLAFVTDNISGVPDLARRVRSLPGITIMPQTEIVSVLGDANLTGVRFKNLATGKEDVKALNGLFVNIGMDVNTDPFKDIIETNRYGEIISRGRGRTSLPGVFVAGDAGSGSKKQLIIAAGKGADAATAAIEYLTSIGPFTPCADCDQAYLSPQILSMLEGDKKEKIYSATDVSDDEFFEEVLTHKGYTILDVRKNGCPDCEVAEQFFGAAKEEHGEIKFSSIELDRNSLAVEWVRNNENIQHVPTFILLFDGKEVARRVDMEQPWKVIEELIALTEE